MSNFIPHISRSINQVQYQICHVTGILELGITGNMGGVNINIGEIKTNGLWNLGLDIVAEC